MPTDQRHFPIVEASKAWRKNTRTFVALANETVASEYAHFGDSSEVWGYYPDDEPLKGLHPGDSRAALTPFLAHEVCTISLIHILNFYSYLLVFTCIFTQPAQLVHEWFSFFLLGTCRADIASICLSCGTMPPCAIILFVLNLKIRLNFIHYTDIGECCSRQQKWFWSTITACTSSYRCKAMHALFFVSFFSVSCRTIFCTQVVLY